MWACRTFFLGTINWPASFTALPLEPATLWFAVCFLVSMRGEATARALLRSSSPAAASFCTSVVHRARHSGPVRRSMAIVTRAELYASATRPQLLVYFQIICRRRASSAGVQTGGGGALRVSPLSLSALSLSALGAPGGR